MAHIDRRTFLGAGSAALAAGALAGCGSDGGGESGDSNSLRVAWYGGQPAHEGVEAALNAYTSDNADISLATEKAAFGDYWDKLATQVAGGQGPDVLRMSMSYFAEYADRGALLDLSEYAGSTITTSSLDPDVATSGEISDGLYGIGQSSITHATFRNPQLVDEYGLELPAEWSWDDFVEFCQEFSDAAGPGKYGTTDAGGNFQIFEVWARQHGTELFDESGLVVTADIVEEWLVMWQSLREAGAAPTSDITAESTGFETSQLAQLGAAIEFGWVQQVAFYQPVVPTTRSRSSPCQGSPQAVSRASSSRRWTSGA